MEEQAPTLTERQGYWLEQIRACEAAGQGMKAYAATHDLDLKALSSWKKTLVNKGVLPRTRPARFQRAQVAAPVVDGQAWRVQLPNGISVMFVGPVDADTLSTVLNTAVTLG